MTDSFLGYRGPADLHDAVITAVSRTGDSVIVRLRSVERQELVIRFHGVQRMDALRAEGMMIHALAELGESPGLHRFSFVNWEDEDDARLEVVCKTLEWDPDRTSLW